MCCPSDPIADDPRSIAEMRVSAKLVYKVLEYEGPLTRQQLAERTRLTSRAIGDVLADLEREGYIEKDVYLPDARQRIYRLRVPG